ncbi:MAG: helix-turn-helix domain-containing protein [Acidimicrobiales bacterium]|nr:helix-turn-helix domain-containing protein [Acidimicrobiales bacterium]
MGPFDDLGAFIRDQRSAARLSVRRLSELAGISNPYLSQIERGLRKPSAEILQQIARALAISAETLYVRAGILDESSDTPDVSIAIMADPKLSDEQRMALMQLYRIFLRSDIVEGGPSQESISDQTKDDLADVANSQVEE